MKPGTTKYLAVVAVGLTSGHIVWAAQHRISSAAELTRLEKQLRPGDEIIMTDGAWLDQAVVFRGAGTEERPITLRAETPGKVVLGGTSSVTIDGEYLVVSGLYLKDGTSRGDGVRIVGNHCRLTESVVVGGVHNKYVNLLGVSGRVDHCYLAGKTSGQPTLQVELDGRVNHHLIDHNHFGPRPPLGRNGGETIRIGHSWSSMSSSATVVEYNLFDRCDGEIEIISSKSCDNIFRYNTFTNCAGMITLRHGNRCRVEGNFIFGNHERGSGGIRVIGEDHTIINNYIDGGERGGFWITAGIPDSPLVGYFQARNCLVAFNTIVDSRRPGIDLDAGMGSSGRTLLPENITIANNLIVMRSGEASIIGKEGKGWKWVGNLVSGAGDEASNADKQRPGVRHGDPKLVRAPDGLMRPSVEAPLSGAEQGEFEEVKTDIDGQPRGDSPNVGCDQISAAPVKSRPLTPIDVGPAWLDRSH